MNYRDYDALITPARPSAGLLRLAFGLLVGTVVYTGLGIVVIAFGAGVMSGVYQRPDGIEMLLAADTPLAINIWLYGFTAMIAALWLVMRLLHRRDLAGLIGEPALALRQFLKVSGAVILLNLVLVPLPVPNLLELTANLDLRRWAMVLPLAMAGLIVQVSAEELVFRGYLQSQLAARFAHPAIWLCGPAVLFGVLHYQTETAGDNAWLLVVAATAFGLAAADLTARAGTLGPAIALHFVNNFVAIMLIANTGMLDGMALWRFDADLADNSTARTIVMLDLLLILCSWLAARLVLRR